MRFQSKNIYLIVFVQLFSLIFIGFFSFGRKLQVHNVILQPSICCSPPVSCTLPIQVAVEKDGFEMEVNRMAFSASHIFPLQPENKNNFIGGCFHVATFAVQWTKTVKCPQKHKENTAHNCVSDTGLRPQFTLFISPIFNFSFTNTHNKNTLVCTTHPQMRPMLV